jgi:hypothetical protein
MFHLYALENYFAVGKGLVPSLKSGAGWRIPDENG